MKRLLRLLGHQKWIRFGVRDRILRFFHNPDKAISQGFTVPFFGKTYNGNLNSYIDWNVYYYGSYTGEELLLMRDSIKKSEKPVVVDIGANIGHHTLYAATIASKIYSFEPFKAVSEKLIEKRDLNGLKNIELHEIGLGNTNEILNFHPPYDNNRGTGSFIGNIKTNSKLIQLPIRIADEYFEENSIDRVDYLKIDVEGYEEYVLKGLTKTIANCRPIIFFEWSGIKREKPFNYKSLFPDDYQLYDYTPSKPLIFFFQQYRYSLRMTDFPNITDGNKVAIPNEKTVLFSKTVFQKHISKKIISSKVEYHPQT